MDDPPKKRGFVWTRTLGLNPYEIWSEDYYAWNRGYEDQAALLGHFADAGKDAN